ncbi:MAG TPA: hypothetical protein VLX29_00380 [Nitrospirota bacterium]|nr:hypothetical protein [Nitrospirota bacterium]
MEIRTYLLPEYVVGKTSHDPEAGEMGREKIHPRVHRDYFVIRMLS